MPKLLEQVRERVRLKHYSIRTEQAYLHWVRNYILFHKKRPPKEMAKNEVTEFLTHLAVKRKVAASTQNQVLSPASGAGFNHISLATGRGKIRIGPGTQGSGRG